MNNQDTEKTSMAVPPRAKQIEEIHDRWSWVERSVWSERMLQALEQGVKGGKWFSLIDKVWTGENLGAAWRKTLTNQGRAGIDGQSIQQFTLHVEKELDQLQRELQVGDYQPQPVRRCWIPKLGSKEKRPLGIPTVHATKTRIVNATQKGGFDFLGYHFERGMKWPRQKSLDKFKDTIRRKTRRTQGNSMAQVIDAINPILRGWFEYFKHSHWTAIREVEGWVRGRLRSILRRWQGKRGRGRGSDHQRWPNAYFEKLGFFSLVKARRLALQSL